MRPGDADYPPGGTTEYALDLPGGERMLAHEQNGPQARLRSAGDTVAIGWRAADARLVVRRA